MIRGTTPTETLTVDKNISDHTIYVSYGSTTLYVKLNGSWVEVQTAYRKQNGSWVQVAVDSAFTQGVNYLKG